MANIGEIAELINSKNARLDVGSDTYIMVQDIHLHISRRESIDAMTDGNPFYSYGPGDNWFTATLFVTTPELDSLNTLNLIDSAGDMPSTAWKIVYTDRAASPASKTFACTGVLRDIDVLKRSKSGATIEMFVRITAGSITVS